MSFNVNGSFTEDQIKKLNAISNDAANEARKKSQVLDKDAFLKLMMVQLQNQNPLSPTDNTEFIGQMAQFSTVEQLANIAGSTETTNQLNALISAQLEDMQKIMEANTGSGTDTEKLLEQNTKIIEELMKLNASLTAYFERSEVSKVTTSEALLNALE